MKNRSQIYDMNRSRPSHGHRYTKYKIYFFIMMVIRPVEMKKILGGGLPILKYCRPPWLNDEKHF